MTITHGESDARLAVIAARAGAAVVRDLYGGRLARYEKGAGDFATEADLAAERAVLGVLRWLVDPLCGTLNYAVRTMLVGVNVALRVDGETTAAATADPFTGEVFWTDGTRARLSTGDDGDMEAGEELTPSAASALVDVNLDPPFPNAPAFRATSLLADPGFTERFRPRVISSTLAVAWVAAGRRAAYVTDGHLADSVHFAAGIALCQAAGCTVTGLYGEPPYTGRGGLIAAADPATHAALLAMAERQARKGRDATH
ncbi:inositol monophosphatase family protein [Streptomyces sp. NPDC047813]|uniref:inositol monophosphatase family protein n=1 Tax=Streptomyces sp. NPDC047813 TaxID=3154608 RepID=UPI0033C4D54B